MQTYGLYLESGPRKRKTLVHVLDLLGCVVGGPTTDEAVAAAPDAIRAYLRFLHRHGEAVDPNAQFQTAIAEHITEGQWLGNGSPQVLFQPDLQPLSPEETETAIQRLDWMHRDMARQVNELRSNQRELASQDNQRALEEILRHVLEAGSYYLWSSFGKTQAVSDTVKQAEKGADVLVCLERAYQAMFERLRAATTDERQRTVPHGKEMWTARKTVRRLLEHQWEHLAEIAARSVEPLS